MAHNAKSGVAQFAAEDDRDCLEQIRRLLSFLPSNHTEHPPRVETGDSPDRLAPELDSIMPDNPRGDLRHAGGNPVASLITAISSSFTLTMLRTSLWDSEGSTAVPLASLPINPMSSPGCLDVDSSDKATRFIRFCDCFNIPMLTIADVPGYLPGSEQEWSGVIRHGAKLLWCYSEATVPKMTLIIRKNYGGAYIAMCSRHLGSDMTLAWPTAEIAVMGAEGAANIIFRREIQEARRS